MLQYPAKLTAEPEGGFTVTFRDVPEAITFGETPEEALQMASDCLATAAAFYIEDGCDLPVASEAEDGEHVVTARVSH